MSEDWLGNYTYLTDIHLCFKTTDIYLRTLKINDNPIKRKEFLHGILLNNKKVLLRERKRHIARCVANAWRGGGYLTWQEGGSTYLTQGVPTLDGAYLP